MSPDPHTILRVSRSKAQAKDSYDRLSPFYDLFAGGFESKYRNKALKQLKISQGETVLEIGFGTGHSLQQMAEAVGQAGRVYGIDISPGMLAASRRRLKRAGLEDRVELTCEDATKLPYEDSQFNVVFTSFALELLDSPEIPQVLTETKRVLKPNGRLGVVSMSRENESAPFLKIYEWLHQKFPQYIDCRPIYLEQSVKDAGYEIRYKECGSLMGLPVDIVIGVKAVNTPRTIDR